jgi:DNA-binding XRE family transcriptional regulator
MRAEEIQAKRAALGLTQGGLAAYLGKSKWTVAQWEQGRRIPDMDEFSLRVAFATAARAISDGKPLPDWRTSPVMPEPEGGDALAASPVEGSASI